MKIPTHEENMELASKFFELAGGPFNEGIFIDIQKDMVSKMRATKKKKQDMVDIGVKIDYKNKRFLN